MSSITHVLVTDTASATQKVLLILDRSAYYTESYWVIISVWLLSPYVHVVAVHDATVLQHADIWCVCVSDKYV